MKETLESILQFSKDMFPKTTLETQLERFNQEWEELAFARTEKEMYEEMADMAITAVRVLDFNIELGAMCFKDLWETIDNSKKFEKALQAKMKTNRERALQGYWKYDKQTKQYVAKHKLDNKE